VSARVGSGADVRISEDTSYPFGDIIDFRVGTGAPVEFPFYIRIPEWCSRARIFINGEDTKTAAPPSTYVGLRRT
jgi:DUF1680 family protein